MFAGATDQTGYVTWFRILLGRGSSELFWNPVFKLGWIKICPRVQNLWILDFVRFIGSPFKRKNCLTDLTPKLQILFVAFRFLLCAFQLICSKVELNRGFQNHQRRRRFLWFKCNSATWRSSDQAFKDRQTSDQAFSKQQRQQRQQNQ